MYDTGRGYPAAIFDAPGTIVGRTYRLRADRLDEALAVLDEEESSVPGGYRRVVVTTEAGTTAWAYEYGGGLELTADRVRRLATSLDVHVSSGHVREPT